MASLSRGNETNFDWLRKSCDISTCDLSLDGNPEKYGRPMKSAITLQHISISKRYLHLLQTTHFLINILYNIALEV